MSILGSHARASGYLATPTYVKTNLFLNLDAATYSGAGSTWSDLSGNGRNATLTNGPTYSSSLGGYFHFTDTSFQYAITAAVPSISTNWTVEAWYRPSKSVSSGKTTAIVANEYDGSNLNYSLGNNNATVTYTLAAGFFNGTWRTTTGFNPTVNTWYQSVQTYNGSTLIQYTNAVSQSTLSYSGTSVSGGAIRIARRWDSAANDSNNFFDGDISVIRIYSTALTSAQILQNYNAIKGRYGL